ncbi:MAG: hypothetical protein ACFFCF_03565 [Promethearchaeota archaeon]
MKSQFNIRVTGISTKNSEGAKVSATQKRRESCILFLILIFTPIFAILLIINPVFAIPLGGLFAILTALLLIPRDRPPKELERLRRDTARRAHIPPFGATSGILFLEDGGPTKPKKHDEDY